jgi:rhodanese-related sulfurtransferase
MNRSVLAFGGEPPSHIVNPGDRVTVVPAESCAFVQLVVPFDMVWVDTAVVDIVTESACRAVLHGAVQHLAPGGLMLVDDIRKSTHERIDALTPALELSLLTRSIVDGGSVESIYRRTARFTIHDMVRSARSTIKRVEPCQLAAALQDDERPTVLDTRTPTDRERFGVIPGSLHVPRTILEWSLDPANGYRNAAVTSLDQQVVIVCNGGYSSSLAAANLAAIGFTNVADLVGGHHAWVRFGLPVEPPDHWSLDY